MKGLALILLVVLAWGAGLLAFAHRVQRLTPAPPPPRSDAIVALTGASNVRLAAAAQLLDRGLGRRLLISGVNPAARRSDVRDVTRDFGRAWDCCVDLGRAAEDTRGNAAETADWARRHGYRSLIVVTADFHMPRALLELRASMPDVALRPYPVETGTLQARRWWRDSVDARRMTVEYCKYLVVWARSLVLGLGDGDHGARAEGGT
ncbi:MAG: YdcF family protein [Caulobacteraceae bacterium]|nr:YdcF family protein [Caulobacter sp.]